MAINRVLVVDDSATDRLAMTQMLERLGYSVISAQSGEEGIEMAERELPDLIVMDVVMPGMSGFQATRALTKSPLTAHIPVFVCTGKSQVTDQAWALKMGAKACLIKPLEQEIFVEQVQALA
jgi:twitching motility two-component system response regulator PilH